MDLQERVVQVKEAVRSKSLGRSDKRNCVGYEERPTWKLKRKNPGWIEISIVL